MFTYDNDVRPALVPPTILHRLFVRTHSGGSGGGMVDRTYLSRPDKLEGPRTGCGVGSDMGWYFRAGRRKSPLLKELE